MIDLDPTVQVSLVTGVFGFLVAIIGLMIEGMRRQHRTLGEVRDHAAASLEQVQNSHETNLRDDVDRVLNGLDRILTSQNQQAEMLRQHGYELGHLRRDIQLERTERLAVSDRVDNLTINVRDSALGD